MDADARRTCVVATVSQFGNIIERGSCHSADQTGVPHGAVHSSSAHHHVGCNLLFRNQGTPVPRLSLFHSP